MKKNIINAVILAITLCLLLTASAEASGNAPGSPGDPLVSQSYVDSKYNELFTMVTNITGEYNASQQGQNQGQNQGQSGGLSAQEKSAIIEEIINYLENQSSVAMETYAPVYAQAGQVIVGGEGTEIILRSGKAVGYVTGPNGISDVTTGADIMNNESIYLNHMLIVPRNDGRGIRATTEIWMLIKGTYTIMY